MKELYISPKADLISFIAEERLAGSFDFEHMEDNPFNPSDPDSSVASQTTDIHLPFPKL